SNQVLKEYALNVLDQQFLFKSKARSFFQELYSQANNLLTRESLLNGQLNDIERKNHQQKRAETLQWFVLQPDKVREIFYEYLKVEN
ncbi:MAG TPA: hypothetical protein VK810_02825, partial [Dongiaceae bacterium]|nr:hypothetical protein [Dongiaceae bacterium]